MRAVVNGSGKKNDIRQSEARSSKQRLKGENIYREKGSASIVTENGGHTPEKIFTAWTCIIASSHRWAKNVYTNMYCGASTTAHRRG